MHWRDPNDRSWKVGTPTYRRQLPLISQKCFAIFLAALAVLFFYRTAAVHPQNLLPTGLWILAAAIWWQRANSAGGYAAVWLALMYSKGTFA
jgi:hypothetical protein